MNWGAWLLWGFVATLVLTTIMAGSTALRLTRINMPFMLGTLFTADREKAKLIGFFVHLIDGWVFALLYLLAFHSMHAASWWRGAVIGVIHATFVLTVGLMLLPGLHPRMASERHGPELARVLEPPGLLALNYGWRTPISVLVAHVVFGMILGAFYSLG
jgi:uncharacterized membrane protein YagU involved in acid resistance